MRNPVLSRVAPLAAVVSAVSVVSVVSIAGCGLESVFWNAGHEQYARPASKIRGTVPAGTTLAQITVIDGDGAEVKPFLAALDGQSYELQLPSAKYSMLRVRVVAGNYELRAVVPSIGEESAVSGVDLDARNVTETLVAEARLSADGSTFKQVTPEAYVGSRGNLRKAFDVANSPAQQLLKMVERLLTLSDPALSVTTPSFFNQPVFTAMWEVKTSALDGGYLLRNPFDFVGDGQVRKYSDDFDAKLAEVAKTKIFNPAGCPDPNRIRMVFTADFNAASKNGNCGMSDRFKWATDKPGKSMFFVGWVHKESELQDAATNSQLGLGTPNSIIMYDDGTNGDQKAGDNIWSIYFDVPKSAPGKVLRIGYKYTWGTPGAPWTGSEEWPGNSRILEVVDDNNDNFVYRHDVFGDEATNKDNSNLNTGPSSKGSIDWTTDLHGCGTPEAHENKYDNNSCMCGSVLTPKWLGPLTVTCTE